MTFFKIFCYYIIFIRVFSTLNCFIIFKLMNLKKIKRYQRKIQRFCKKIVRFWEKTREKREYLYYDFIFAILYLYFMFWILHITNPQKWSEGCAVAVVFVYLILLGLFFSFIIYNLNSVRLYWRNHTTMYEILRDNLISYDNEMREYIGELNNLINLRKSLVSQLESMPVENEVGLHTGSLYSLYDASKTLKNYPHRKNYDVIPIKTYTLLKYMIEETIKRENLMIESIARLKRRIQIDNEHQNSRMLYGEVELDRYVPPIIINEEITQKIDDYIQKHILEDWKTEEENDRLEAMQDKIEEEEEKMAKNKKKETDNLEKTNRDNDSKKSKMIFIIFSTDIWNFLDLNFYFISVLFFLFFIFYFLNDGRFSISTTFNKSYLKFILKNTFNSQALKSIKYTNSFLIFFNTDSIYDTWYFSGKQLIQYVAFIEHFEFLDFILAFNILLLVLFSTNILFAKNAMFSLLSLIYIFVNSGFLLIFFNLEFFGLLYIIIYVGAIAVLFLFIIMMLKFEKNTQVVLISFKRRFLNWMFNFLIFSFILFYFFYFYKSNFLDKIVFFNTGIFPEFFNISYLNSIKENQFVIPRFFNIQRFFDDLNHLSFSLYLDYVYIFLLAGLILLLSMIAPIVLTYRQRFDIKLQKASFQLLKNKKNILFLKDLK